MRFENERDQKKRGKEKTCFESSRKLIFLLVIHYFFSFDDF